MSTSREVHSMADAAVGPIGWERALLAAEKVQERLRKATKALDWPAHLPPPLGELARVARCPKRLGESTGTLDQLDCGERSLPLSNTYRATHDDHGSGIGRLLCRTCHLV